ncbi:MULTISPECIES: hypothetical protein [unclassified Mycobacterium]|uniref:DUF7155 family protein n=1 Tax=unclassified Mycobacterium TaxID=2642494 RepID=UPI000491496E|nr:MULTISPECIES: hypothetical protein [unclassified Mycobacterium]SEB06721.1 hypothetical protein SAMN04488580_106365 [Mycobacterium sp. 283mftsu]
MTIGATRLFAAAALVATAVAAPVVVALSSAPSSQTADGGCLAWFGNKEDGNCMGRSNGQPVNVGTPWGIWGPQGGLSSGPLLPGQTWNQPLG